VTLSTVTWRQAVAAIAATLFGLLAVTVVVRSDGLPAVDAASGRATSWFVHQPTGRAVLVDGYGGRALASLDTGAQGNGLSVADGGTGVYVLNDVTAEAQPLDSSALRLGTPFGLSALGAGRALTSYGQAGLVVVNADESEANVVPSDGDPITFPVDAGTATQIAPDGSIWSIVDGDLRRTTSTTTQTIALGVPTATLSLVGNTPFVVDTQNRRARLGTGAWQPLPTDADPSEIVTQVPGPTADCGWVGANNDLWCVSSKRLQETSTIEGLDISGSDSLAIAGDAAALVRRGPSSIVRFDWRAGRILDDAPASVASDATLAVTANVDLIWIDDTAGDFVWSVNPWGIRAIDKNARGILVLGEDGTVVDQGQSSQGVTPGTDNSAAVAPEIREPDNNGVDDPPVAVDDPVTARSGASVPVQVTINDYDPDGEAVAVSSVGVPGHGSVDIGTASTVVYTPEPGYVGIDQFTYTIVDGNGTPASANVVIELLAPGSTNKPPVGVADLVETGAGVPVIIDVLLNDVDPERDALRLGGFSPPQGVGQASVGDVTETIGPSGLPALRFAPTEGFEGTAIFSYRPIDALDAVGADVEVRVEVARAGDENRPPVVQPDAIRLRRNVKTPLPVLVNDTDPDGDVLKLSVVEPLPAGLDVAVEGAQLAVTARAGAANLVPFSYEVDDGHGHVARSSVLVVVIDDVEPNRPPVVTADSDKVVVGQSIVVDVTANDVDPDGDPLTVVSVSQPVGGVGQAVVFSRTAIQFTPSPLGDEDAQANAKFTYTVSDGNGHEVAGEVTITVLPEPLPEPPFARDDSTFTFVDVPVTVDVLRNDGDPSGGRPSLVGTPGCPSGGRATVTADSQVRYDPPPGQSGAFRCTYEVTNSRGLRASASIIVSVREPQVTNLPPDAVNDTLTVEVGATQSIDVVANDNDRDGSNSDLKLVSSTAPTLGTATRAGNVITFVAGTQTGNTTINYQVSDTAGGVSLGRLLITVAAKVNRAPIAVTDTQTIFGPGVPQQFNVLVNDSDPDETPGGLSVVSASRISGDGTVTLVGSVVTISPNPGFVGQIVATYTMRDGGGLTATASVVLIVQPPLNRPPDARDDVADVINGGTVSTAVLFNDVDPDGDPLTVALTGGPDATLGSAVLNTNRSITFTAVPGASGTALITYQVSDGTLTDTAVLRINVRACADSAPVASDGFLTTGYQQPIAVDLTGFGSGGNIVDVAGPPSYVNGIYTPPAGENGNVSITYAVVNSCRLRATGQITIDVNQDPKAQPKSINLTRGDQVVVPVTDLATDAEPLTIGAVNGAPGWTTSDAAQLVITPPVGTDLGTYPFTVTVSDPGGLSVSVSVTVTVTNRPPVAVGDAVDVTDGTSRNVVLVDNDTDADSGGALTIQSISSGTIVFSNGEAGTVVVGPVNRSVTVDPLAGLGTATFTYTVRDADGGVSAPATVTVNGPLFNQAPTANDQTVVVTAGVSAIVVLDASDPDGPEPSVNILSDPAAVVTSKTGVTLSVLAPGPGTFTVTYQASDGVALSRVATLTIQADSATTLPPPAD
jgi:large repetitive protein